MQLQWPRVRCTFLAIMSPRSAQCIMYRYYLEVRETTRDVLCWCCCYERARALKTQLFLTSCYFRIHVRDFTTCIVIIMLHIDECHPSCSIVGAPDQFLLTINVHVINIYYTTLLKLDVTTLFILSNYISTYLKYCACLYENVHVECTGKNSRIVRVRGPGVLTPIIINHDLQSYFW